MLITKLKTKNKILDEYKNKLMVNKVINVNNN